MSDERNLYGRATGLNERGRHATFAKAVNAAFADLLREQNPFFARLSDRWDELFPGLAIRPGRCEDGIIFLYVRSAPLLFAMRPKLRAVKAKIAALPDAPKKLELRLEVHAK